jgi:hypothetical protein
VSASAREEVGAIKVKEPMMCQQGLELWNVQERKPLSAAQSVLDDEDGGPMMRFFMLWWCGFILVVHCSRLFFHFYF